MNRIDMSNSFLRSKRRLMMFEATLVSRLDVASSQINNFGFMVRALAMDALCHSPPLKSPGLE